jgi:hypothetical protein
MTSVPRAVVPYDPFDVEIIGGDLPFVNVLDYGASGGGSADETAAVSAAVAVLNAAGGGTLWFPFGSAGAYNVASVLSSTLFTFTSLSGIRLMGEGVTITDTTVYAGAQNATLIDFVACKNIHISGIDFVAPVKANYATAAGLTHIAFRQGCTVVNIDATFTGGWAALRPWKANADADTYKSTNIRANIVTTNVERPLSAEYSGDNSEYRITSTNSGRSFIIYGVRGVDIRLRQTDTTLSGSAQIGAYGGKGCEDVRIWIQDRDAIKSSTAIPVLDLQFSDATAAYHRNIELYFDVLANAGNPPGNIFEIAKYDNASAADSTGRGHVLDGLLVSGVMESWSSRGAIGQIGAFASTDIVRRVRFRDISCPATTGNAITFAAGNALQGTIELSNCYLVAGKVNVSNTTGRTLMTGVRAVDLNTSTADTSPQNFTNCVVTGATTTSRKSKTIVNSLMAGVNEQIVSGYYMTSLTVADAAVASLSLPDITDIAGMLIVVNGGGASGTFSLLGANHLVQEAIDTNNSYTVTAATGASTNVYWSAGNSRYEIENNSGSSQTYQLFYYHRL